MRRIVIKNIEGDVLFEHKAVNNTFKLTVELAVKNAVCLSGANLEWIDLQCADLRGADLSDANFSSSYLCGADLSGANLSNVDLLDADLSDANLSNVNLENADLYITNLSGVNLSNANLENANLDWSNLSGADLSNSNLKSTDLQRADLRCTTLLSVDFKSANLNGTIFNNKFKTNCCKWRIMITPENFIKIGCKKKSIQEWDDWFKGTEEYETPRNTKEFQLIYRNYLNVKELLSKTSI